MSEVGDLREKAGDYIVRLRRASEEIERLKREVAATDRLLALQLDISTDYARELASNRIELEKLRGLAEAVIELGKMPSRYCISDVVLKAREALALRDKESYAKEG